MKYLTENKNWEINKDYNIDKLLYLLIDRYDEVSIRKNSCFWYNDKNKKHRYYDLPAITNNLIGCFWFENGIFLLRK